MKINMSDLNALARELQPIAAQAEGVDKTVAVLEYAGVDNAEEFVNEVVAELGPIMGIINVAGVAQGLILLSRSTDPADGQEA